ncbi:hypothetical protein RTP6_001699 [Batrachochytrium dendrobatidis]
MYDLLVLSWKQTQSLSCQRHLCTRHHSSIRAIHMKTLATVLLLLLPMSAAQNLGKPCKPTIDHFACEARNFLTCDTTASTWQVQNVCASGPCTADPTFGSYCYNNSLPGGSNAPSTTSSSSASLSPSKSTDKLASTSIPTLTSNAESNTTSGGLSSGLVIGISVGVSLLVLIIVIGIAAYVLMHRKSKNKDELQSEPALSNGARKRTSTLAGLVMVGNDKQHNSEYIAGSRDPNSLLPASNTNRTSSDANGVGAILEKAFIVTTDYEPCASDELRLRVGDSIVLDLLFNDGWAKGKNESTRQEGILPVACITQLN